LQSLYSISWKAICWALSLLEYLWVWERKFYDVGCLGNGVHMDTASTLGGKSIGKSFKVPVEKNLFDNNCLERWKEKGKILQIFIFEWLIRFRHVLYLSANFHRENKKNFHKNFIPRFEKIELINEFSRLRGRFESENLIYSEHSD
jgi:hypothetical protein